MTYTLSERGRDLIKKYEGLRLDAYLCPAGVWTIGWGHTLGVQPGDVIDEAMAEAYLDEDVRQTVLDVNELVTVPITQGMIDALVSFVFNLGSDIDADTIAEGLGDSTLLRKLNAGDYAGAAEQFLLWNKARVNGRLVVLPGLVARRTGTPPGTSPRWAVNT